MEDYDKNKIIEQISLAVNRFQKGLDSVSGAAIFFSTITQYHKRSDDELKKLLFDLYEKNIQNALNRNEFLIREVKEKHGDILDITTKINQLKRRFTDITKEKENSISKKEQKYISLFNEIIQNINYIKDNKQKLISEGKKKYLKIYLLTATLITTFYCFISGFYFKWNINTIKEKFFMVILIWLIILYLLWRNLYNWINKN